MNKKLLIYPLVVIILLSSCIQSDAIAQEPGISNYKKNVSIALVSSPAAFSPTAESTPEAETTSIQRFEIDGLSDNQDAWDCDMSENGQYAVSFAQGTWFLNDNNWQIDSAAPFAVTSITSLPQKKWWVFSYKDLGSGGSIFYYTGEKWEKVHLTRDDGSMRNGGEYSPGVIQIQAISLDSIWVLLDDYQTYVNVAPEDDKRYANLKILHWNGLNWKAINVPKKIKMAIINKANMPVDASSESFSPTMFVLPGEKIWLTPGFFWDGKTWKSEDFGFQDGLEYVKSKDGNVWGKRLLNNYLDLYQWQDDNWKQKGHYSAGNTDGKEVEWRDTKIIGEGGEGWSLIYVDKNKYSLLWFKGDTTKLYPLIFEEDNPKYYKYHLLCPINSKSVYLFGSYFDGTYFVTASSLFTVNSK
jgi:hypothetical protein